MTKLENRVSEQLLSHEKVFDGLDYPLLTISDTYPGLWLEHVYDSVIYAQMDRTKLYLAENAIRVFMDHQTEEGQLPFRVGTDGEKATFAYTQVQECVSFGSMALAVYEMNHDLSFLQKAFDSTKAWVSWLRGKRMTQGRGLVELFCGYDTGHDNSARILDLGFPRNVRLDDGKLLNAGVLPPDDRVPLFAVDMNCNYYGNLTALSKMAQILGLDSSRFAQEARAVKSALFEICFDQNDGFFYDTDKNLNKRKILSCQIFQLFIEGVLNKTEDKELIGSLCRDYILSPRHFYTPYPFPAVSVSDKTWKKHTAANCWGYFTQGLTVLRTALWMDKYGLSDQHRHLCLRWADAWEKCVDRVEFGQELDPITGEPSSCSSRYSSCMLAYVYTRKRWG